MTRPATACPQYEEACREEAWGLGADRAWIEHRAHCPRCARAFEAARALARTVEATRPTVPPQVSAGLAEAVLAATTRRPRRSFVPRWGAAGAALAAAAAAFATWLAGRQDTEPEGAFFAQADFELLETLDLAETLDLLELLDAFEEMDDV
ncbi:MAG: hypothetical protein Kow0092_33660 [Deferrisomatales bacterium]